MRRMRRWRRNIIYLFIGSDFRVVPIAFSLLFVYSLCRFSYWYDIHIFMCPTTGLQASFFFCCCLNRGETDFLRWTLKDNVKNIHGNPSSIEQWMKSAQLCTLIHQAPTTNWSDSVRLIVRHMVFGAQCAWLIAHYRIWSGNSNENNKNTGLQPKYEFFNISKWKRTKWKKKIK